jgi:RNA polymerase sigma-70 factor (ECF subfamily)
MPYPPDLCEASDQDLVAAARAGHMEAFDQLVRRYRRDVCWFLNRMVRDPDLADDLTQEVFVKAFRQLDSHRPEHSFSAWIIKIANNHALDDFKRVRREFDIVPLEPTPDTSSPRRLTAGALRPVGWSTPTPTPRDMSALGPALDEALAGLRDTHRQCFILREIEGRSYEDIAEILDLPVGTVGTYLNRARKKLRAELGPAYDALRASSITPS